MKFGEKLDLLMRISQTTNSTLARSVSLDPSFVSRLRRGVRTPARNENYVRAIAAYVARVCQSDYQKAALNETMKRNIDKWPEDTEKTTELICHWLSDLSAGGHKSVESFLDGLAQFQFKKVPQLTDMNVTMLFAKPVTNDAVYYGIEGKRNAVLHFLSSILQHKSPQTLLLFSDEDLEWLTGNLEFTAKWAALLSQVIMCGNRVRIIHTVNRNLDEMLSAIEQWLPLYLTGAIEPFYYAKARDGIYRRTLFIAPETAALTSTSVGTAAKNAANFLYTGPATIKALCEEYNAYLSLCRPLMRIFTPAAIDEYLITLAEFEQVQANSVIKTDLFSSITMPSDVAACLHLRMQGGHKGHYLEYQQKRIQLFEERLQNHAYTEVVTIPNLEQIENGLVKVGFSGMMGDTELFYTRTEFAGHLANIIRLLRTYDNYNIYLSSGEMPGYILYVKEDVGVLVAKSSPPSVIFAINESNMTAAFWDYLKMAMNKELKIKPGKAQIITELEAILHSIK